MNNSMTRRHFIGAAAGAAGCLAAGQAIAAPIPPFTQRILNFHGAMEYRPMGRTGLMLSAVSMGGLSRGAESNQNLGAVVTRAVVNRAMELGINYIEACGGPEVLASGSALRGRRRTMHLGVSWPEHEPRFQDWSSRNGLIRGLDLSLQEARLDYVDLWRITLPEGRMTGPGGAERIEEAAARALMTAKKQGKARFTGVSVRNPARLKSAIEKFPEQLDVVLLPCASSGELSPAGNVLGAIRKYNVGVLGGMPCWNGAHDSIRRALGTPGIASVVTAMATMTEIENAARAVMERRALDP